MFKKLLKSQRGQALVELALVLPILLMLFMGIIEYGRVFHAYLAVTNASREGARIAVVGKTEQEIKDRVKTTAGTLDPTELVTDIASESGSVKVSVSYKVPILIPLVEAALPNPFPVSASTTMRLE